MTGMPLGILSCGLSMGIGGWVGSLLGFRLPRHLQKQLPLFLGVCTVAIGMVTVPFTETLPAVIASVLLGSSIGQLLSLEKMAEKFVARILPGNSREGNDASDSEQLLQQLMTVTMVFCFSANGIYGAMVERMGDASILLSKSILDLFTAVAFGSIIGRRVAVIALPAVVIMLGFYGLAGTVLPMMTQSGVLDFRACGGILSVATGLKMSGVKSFPLLNMIPSLLLVIPMSYLWNALLALLR
jgi:uncharacterized membrane protein YqgA involved in biofilm formation